MEKDEKNIVDPAVDTVDNNIVVDDNTELDSSDYTPELPGSEPTVDASVEDPTLATTDEIIPAPVDVAGEEPVAVDPVEPVLDAPLADIAPPVQDIPVDAPVENPVEPVVDIDNPPMDPVIPEDPISLTPEDPVDVPVENPESGDTGCPCGDPNCDGTCGVIPASCESAVTVANLFGTLQECVSITWRFHLKTRVYRVHVVLNEFYEKALDIVDDIIEQYQGIVGVVEDTFTNCVVGDGKSEGEYLTELKAFVENNRCVIGGHSEIDSVVDEFLGLIDSTLYKLNSFSESAVKSFDEFVYEDYTANESCKYNTSDDSDFDGECSAEEE